MMRIGLTIGKFAPLHKGHEYLIQEALKQVDKLYILVYETDLIDISMEQRAGWIKNTFKDDRIITIKAVNPPKQYGMDSESVNIQLEYIKNILKKENIKNITHFFSSEEYGKYVSNMLGAKNVVIDKKRIKVPINATRIRKNIEAYKKYLNAQVYKELENKIK